MFFYLFVKQNCKMGMCITTQNSQQRKNNELIYKVSPNNLNQKEQQILKLIYNDLKLRIPQKALNLQNFLLFFQKNGFWGVRLFQQFAFDESNLITQEQFIYGIAKLIKTDRNKKIQLLFKFFASSSQSNQIENKSSLLRSDSIQRKPKCNDQNIDQIGVKFEQFLVMVNFLPYSQLYNYPKDDLKQILNDKDFFQKQIKNSLVTIGENRRLQSVYNLGVALNKKDIYVFRVEDKSQTYQSGLNCQPQTQTSMVGKDILKQIKQRQIDQTTLKLKDGDNTLEVKTNNIHHLVKKFAINMFKTLNLNYRTGQLNIKQFTEWMGSHNTLYNNYYDGFHNDIWELDPQSKRPKYLSSESEKQGICKYFVDNQKGLKTHVCLRHSIIIVCEQQLNDNPIDVICLQGLQVNKIFEQKQGYGFSITHRDGFYPLKRIFLKNQAIRDDWNEALKYYKGGNVENIYTMGNKIGTGKFSVVYEAVNKETKVQVAIKVIEYKELDMDARKLIAHESSIMQIFCHPLLVQFKDCLQTKTHMYIITELCPGKDLFQFVKQFKLLQEAESAFICQQIIVGVRYMHSFGIIHRDLKPENIMVSFNPKQKKIQTVQIIDFGFANYLSTFADMSPDQVLAGTPNYIAPELLRGEPISYKTDNFAIGSILYFMLSGMLPFNSHTLSDIFAKTLDGNYSFKGRVWDKVSDKAKNLIAAFLQIQPQKRISLQDALKHPWFKQIKDKKTKKATQLNNYKPSEGVQSNNQIRT